MSVPIVTCWWLLPCNLNGPRRNLRPLRKTSSHVKDCKTDALPRASSARLLEYVTTSASGISGEILVREFSGSTVGDLGLFEFLLASRDGPADSAPEPGAFGSAG